MPRLWTVLDTNVYRQLGPADFDRLMSAERSRGVLGRAHIAVIDELLSHLLDPDDRDFRSCLASLRRLASHCLEVGADRHPRLRMLARGDHQVRFILTGEQVRWPDEMDAYAELIQALIGTPPEEYPDWVRSQVARVATHVAAVKEGFVASMWRTVLHWDPTATDWRSISRNKAAREHLLGTGAFGPAGLPTFARLYVEMMVPSSAVASTCGLQVATERALAHFGPAVRFLQATFRRVLTDGIDMSQVRNRNAIYDLIIASSPTSTGALEGLPVWLITTDEALVLAAKESGSGACFRHLHSYSAMLGAPIGDLLAELGASS